ncbi:uncharacterized protein LOC134273720 [Saccostrea cucullata]|uniref:uncharacterized protein LOC134273720 n=1 Tax=Saccostrea cuccullata TaxID=36930 RepID=UPI002ED455A8
MSAIQGNTSTEQGTELESSPSADMINLPNVKYACLPTTFNESSSFDPTFQHHNDIHYYVNITSLVYTSFALTRNGHLMNYLEESSCEVGFEPPIDAGKCSDVCSAKISSCNVSGTWNTYNEDVSVACENTDVLTFPPVKFNSIVYKNRFCLICNPTETHLAETDQSCTLQENSNLTKACLQFPNVHICAGYKNIFCKMCNDINASNCIDVFYKEVIPSTTTPWPTIPPYTWSYRTYFSISSYEQSGILPVEDIYSNCLPNQIYDSSQKTCKNLTCFPGKTQMNDTCVALLASTQNLRYTLPKVIRNDLEIKLIEFTQLSTNWTLVDDIVVNVELSRSEKALSLPYLVWKVHKSQCIVLSDKKKCGSGMFKNALVSPLLRCKQVELKGNEFGVHWTKLRSTFSYLGLSLSSYHFAADATVQYRVCASDISIYKEKLKEMGFIDEGLPLSLLTLSCVCISLLFLVLAFTTYCLFPSLRTLPGINNMILMIFLFLAQMLLIVRPFFRSTGMVVLSALSHISWLLLFFWLQVCSFHMFRVFRQDRRTENSGSYIRKTITKYVSYAFGSSSFIVSCNLIISLIESNGKNTGYDNASSLMTHKISFIVTLILPLTLICLTNIMFYILTSYKIYSSPDIESTSRNRIQFTVYVKLFSLTGLSWLLQIVDTFIEVSILSYFVAILNGLQGFFIFLSYVCNKRVWNLYKKAFGSSFIDQSKTSSGRVTYSNEN